MPKPIIVIQSGDIPLERFEMSRDFMLTSHLTAHIREEYHILMIHTAPEASYIISADNTTVILYPSPTTVAKLIKALESIGQERASHIVKANPEMLKAFNEAMKKPDPFVKEKPTLKSGGISSGPTFREGIHMDELVVPLDVLHKIFPDLKRSGTTPPEASPKVKQALKDMHAIRDAARQHIADIKSSLTAQEIAEWYNVPDIKISVFNSNGEAKSFWDKYAKLAGNSVRVQAKDPDEKQEVFGYKIRRSTMQDLEALITTGGHAAFKVSEDGELFITHAFPKGL